MTSDSSRTPTWVKVFAVVTVLVLAALAVALIAGVQHGPGQHGMVIWVAV
jgi:hypothetical protein